MPKVVNLNCNGFFFNKREVAIEVLWKILYIFYTIIYFLYKAIVIINRNTERTQKGFFSVKHKKYKIIDYYMLLNPSHMDLKTLSLIVRSLLLVTLQLIGKN